MGEVRGKAIQEAFSGAPIGESAAGFRVLSLRIDRMTRSMQTSFLLPGVCDYKIIRALRKSLREYYALAQLEITVSFADLPPEGERAAKLGAFIIGLMAEEKPVMEYVLEDSLWSETEETLQIAIRHGGSELLKSESAAGEIARLFHSFTGKTVRVEFIEEMEEVDLSAKPLPVMPAMPRQEAKEVAPLPDGVILGKAIDTSLIPVSEINEGSGRCTVCGDIFAVDVRDIKEKKLLTFNITDTTDSITCKMFLAPDKYESIREHVKNGAYLMVRGTAVFDSFAGEVVIRTQDIAKASKTKKTDMAEEKRVELHVHTQMSSMDGVSSATALVKQAISYGHPAIAITDHGVVQAFPEAYKAAKGSDIKIILGVEAYFVNDIGASLYKGKSWPIDGEMVAFDIETTGLSPKTERITEIGAVKIRDGAIIDTFSTFANPGKPISAKIVELTGITDAMVADAPSEEEAVKAFLDFCGDAPVIAHNANFDTSFIRAACQRMGRSYTPSVIDTLTFCRAMVISKRQHSLDKMAKYFGIENPSHHRAVNDAQVCAQIWAALMRQLMDMGVTDLADIDKKMAGNVDMKTLPSHHMILLAKTRQGLFNLYTLITKSHMDYFHKTPRIPKSELVRYREGILVGSACEAGELFKAVVADESEDSLLKIADFYDYLEIQPIGNNSFMIANGTAADEEQLRDYNRKIIELGEKLGKPVVATGDVHFLNREDEVYRRILMAGKGFDDADNQAPLYFRTTNEMLEEFGYLGDEMARKVVIENTRLLADMVENVPPVPKEKCPPEIPGSDTDIMNMSREKAERIYGTPLPEIVQKRMDKELDSIINNGFAVMYLIAHKLVKKSNEDGYLVGSRGSVGSSFVAFLSDITEVNALPPHYVCPNCKYSEFVEGMTGSGCDLPDKICPKCGEPLFKDGHDIPFETFLGFDGDKAPDIDLNFSGDYQGIAHKYTEVLFGAENVYKAGTIGTLAEKTAYGYVRKYFEERGKNLRKAELDRLTIGCTGVKRTTGQHPGGIVVLPKGRDINEFCPVQHPADKSESDVKTTHFDYHSIDENLLKLDILGHDDPTVIRMLEDLTGLDAKTIPLDDKETMSLFTGKGALKLVEDIKSTVGTLAIPEFGTKFVRQMLVDTQPKTFSDLIRISGLSHGTDVWLGNAQDIVKSGTANLSGCICTRDDIMLYLIGKEVPPKLSFTIMESVRKGKGLKPEWEEEMRAHNVPEWYIDSCKKIKYMFPKAHAAAYVTMAFRIAYCKVHHPLAFYMAYYSVRADDFDYGLMACGHEVVKQKMQELSEDEGKTQKDKNVLSILEVCDEMYARGFSFCPIDLYQSDAEKFKEVDGKILPPLTSIQGLGAAAARSIAEARKDGDFLSVDDLVQRSGANKSVIEIMSKNGILDSLPEISQTTLFG